MSQFNHTLFSAILVPHCPIQYVCQMPYPCHPLPLLTLLPSQH